MAGYVVLTPDHIRSFYETWAACEPAVRGVPGVVYHKVANRAAGERELSGEGRRLVPGAYAFTDGNHLGGVGIVLVLRRADGSTATKEVSGTVASLSPEDTGELARLRNILPELIALEQALIAVKDGASLTVIHDYEGVGAWMTGRWRVKDPLVGTIIDRCKSLASVRQLSLRFEHQRGHQSAAGGDEYALYNARADALATATVSR